MKKLLGLMCLLMLTGCYQAGYGLSPAMRHGPKEGDGPPEMIQGWNDGCQSGTSSYGWDLYKTFIPFKQDSRLVNNRVYMTNWRDAYSYCRHYINEYGRYGVLGTYTFAQPTGEGNLRDERTSTVGKGAGQGLVPDFLGW